MTIEQLNILVDASEDEHLEFKEAKNRFSFEELVKYCVAMANEGGGRILLGISDKYPRRVVGTGAFGSVQTTVANIVSHIHLKIEGEEILHPDGRVICFSVPSRPLGMPLQYKGGYWMRSGEAVTSMTQDQLRRILDEVFFDFTAGICEDALYSDLSDAAIKKLRKLWYGKSRNAALLNLDDHQLMHDAELLVDGKVTYAALILLGTRSAVGKYLPQAEVVFEYRSGEAAGPAQQREDFREGFLLFEEKIWSLVDSRNDLQHFQHGLFVQDIPTFNGIVIREGILNAVSHRDYRMSGSVFIRQYPRRLEIESPGGFPPGVTPANVLWRQVPRNRRIAEVLARCGFVERAGQGVNLMVEQAIKEAKALPDFSRSDEYQVSVSLSGQIQDVRFLRFLERLGAERLASFTTEDLLILDLMNRNQPISEELKHRMHFLTDNGVIEKVGRGQYIFSRGFHEFLGSKGEYTRYKGLDRETNKQLLLKHIRDNASSGTPFLELSQVLPSHSRDQLKALLRELKAEGLIQTIGIKRGAKWYPLVQ